MIKISHIIHPGIVSPESDLHYAQPVTFETIRVAHEFAKNDVDLQLYAVQYHDEDRIPIPDCIKRLPDLKRSVADVKKFKHKRKLALIKDILDRLYDASYSGYLIYTNVDIALQSYFYKTVSRIIQQGYDAFVINRRTISKTHKFVNEIPLMYSELGEKHKGWDCFVFRRDLYPRFKLGTACIGTGWIGRVMISNMSCFSKKFEIFKDLHATFHIGNDRVWRSEHLNEYLEHNKNECKKILLEFEEKYGPFDRNKFPGRFLWKFFR